MLCRSGDTECGITKNIEKQPRDSESALSSSSSGQLQIASSEHEQLKKATFYAPKKGKAEHEIAGAQRVGGGRLLPLAFICNADSDAADNDDDDERSNHNVGLSPI